MPTGPRAFLEPAGCVWATALHPDPPLKGLVPYLPVRWSEQKIPLDSDIVSESKLLYNLWRIILAVFQNTNSGIYLSIYLSIVLFGPVKPELGVIPSGQENHSGAEHLNFPGGELNVIGLWFFLKEILLCKKIRITGLWFFLKDILLCKKIRTSPSTQHVYSVLFIHWIWRSPVIFFFVFLVYTRHWKTGWK